MFSFQVELFYVSYHCVFFSFNALFLSGILALKQFTELGIGFLLALTLLTYCVDKSIENTFVIHSLHLPISIARIHDEEEVRLALFEALDRYPLQILCLK